MFRSCRALLFKAKAECDVMKNGHTVRLKVMPNPVSSYTKLPASLRLSLALVDPDVEQQEKDARRKLVGELLRTGNDGGKRAATAIMDKLRAQQTGKNTDLFGPVTINVVGKSGEVRKMDTFVSFGSEKDELTPLGKMAQIGMKDLEFLGVNFDYGSWDLSFGEGVGERANAEEEAKPTPEAPADGSEPEPGVDASAADDDQDHRKLDAPSRKLAASMLPKRDDFGIPPPTTSPEGPLAYAR